MAVPFYVPEGDGDGRTPNRGSGTTTGNNTTSTSASSSQQQSPNDPNNNNQHHNTEQILRILYEALYRVGGWCFFTNCLIIIVEIFSERNDEIFIFYLKYKID